VCGGADGRLVGAGAAVGDVVPDKQRRCGLELYSGRVRVGVGVCVRRSGWPPHRRWGSRRRCCP
jgi:hypothetical protein